MEGMKHATSNMLSRETTKITCQKKRNLPESTTQDSKPRTINWAVKGEMVKEDHQTECQGKTHKESTMNKKSKKTKGL